MRATADSVVMTGGALGDRIMKDGSSAPTVSTLRRLSSTPLAASKNILDLYTDGGKMN